MKNTSSWQGKNAGVWNIAGILFLIAGVANLINDMVVVALGCVVLALAFFAIAQDVKKRHKI